MKRRDFVGKLGLTSAVLMTPAMGGGAGTARAAVAPGQVHDHPRLEGPNANAVVNFGQWKTAPPLDRYPNTPMPPATNSHLLLPARVSIVAGGSVSFIISGLHQILVYGPDTKPEDIVTTLPTGAATTGVPLGVPLVNDPNNRVYRGPDPSLLGSLDRVESVHFPNPGTFLVICGIRGHFVNDKMYGYVVVLPA